MSESNNKKLEGDVVRLRMENKKLFTENKKLKSDKNQLTNFRKRILAANNDFQESNANKRKRVTKTVIQIGDISDEVTIKLEEKGFHVLFDVEEVNKDTIVIFDFEEVDYDICRARQLGCRIYAYKENITDGFGEPLPNVLEEPKFGIGNSLSEAFRNPIFDCNLGSEQVKYGGKTLTNKDFLGVYIPNVKEYKVPKD
ncbi:hypothetical protein AKO1_014992 [Acrasis kona]|uniref:Uncharacterized protein n=1 Tax=Acrasis kona TaxID=1008807 RepID=A0AAW2YZZ4_9EUKA